MRLKKEQIHKLSQAVLETLEKKSLIQAKTSRETLLTRIDQAITADMSAEDDLDAEAQKLLDQFRPQIASGQLNERELFLKIKRELAKKKKLVL